VLEAAVFGVNDGQVLERYTFYAVPLLLIAFCRGLDERAGGARKALGYAAAAAVLLVPLSATIRGSDDGQSPALVGLHHLSRWSRPPELLWAPVLAVAVVAVNRGASRRLALSSAVGILAVVAAGAASGLSGLLSSTDATGLTAPAGSALVVSPEGDPYVEMKTLFWNPSLERVVALGAPAAPDGFPALAEASFAPARGGFVAGGRTVPGSFDLGWEGAYVAAGSPPATGFDRFRAPAAIVFGWSPLGRPYLAPVGRILLAAASRPVALHLRLASPAGAQTLRVDCPGSVPRSAVVGARPTVVTVTARAGGGVQCRLALVAGEPEVFGRMTYGPRVLGVSVTTG